MKDLVCAEMSWLGSELGVIALAESPYVNDRVTFANMAITAVRRMLDARAALTTQQRDRAQDAFAYAIASCLVEPRGPLQ
jgi:hypothetical protein